MVEVGNLQIGGSIQTAEIERGIKRIDTGLKDISNSGKSVGSDFERIGAQGKRIATVFGTMAIAGSAALLGFAKNAPAVAGAMAKMKLSMLKLKMAAGVALKPMFDWLSEKLQRLAGWVHDNPKPFANMVTGVLLLGGAFVTASIVTKIAATITAFKTLSTFFAVGAGAALVITLGTIAAAIGVIQGISNVKDKQAQWEEEGYTPTLRDKIEAPSNIRNGKEVSGAAIINRLFDRWFRNKSELEAENFI